MLSARDAHRSKSPPNKKRDPCSIRLYRNTGECLNLRVFENKGISNVAVFNTDKSVRIVLRIRRYYPTVDTGVFVFTIVRNGTQRRRPGTERMKPRVYTADKGGRS